MEHKSLKDYTDDELYEFLQHNNCIELTKLAGICSEVLRRQLEKERRPCPMED